MKKADITFHGLGTGGYRVVPAVNVKIKWLSGVEWERLADKVRADHNADARFSKAWIDQHMTDSQRNTWWDAACSDAWGQLEEDVNAENVFGRTVKIYSEGRSAGWAYVDKLTNGERVDIESWDAVALARWAKFAKFARQTADDVPYQYLSLVYMNVFEPWAAAADSAADLEQRLQGC